MASNGESCPPRRAGKRRSRRFLELLRSGEVFDASAVQTDQVVMVVICKVLRKLVASEFVARDDSVDDTGLLQQGEIPIDGAQGEPLVRIDDLRDRERIGRFRERLHDQLPILCVSLVDFAQSFCCGLMSLGRHMKTLSGVRMDENAVLASGGSLIALTDEIRAGMEDHGGGHDRKAWWDFRDLVARHKPDP